MRFAAAAAAATLAAILPASTSAATVPPRLPDLSHVLGHPRSDRIVVFDGLIFSCFHFDAANGFLVECYVVGRAHTRPPPKTPNVPGA